MEQSRLHKLEEQCIQDCDPPCTAYCPVHVNIREMVRSITAGDFKGGYNTLHRTIPFPEIIARTCDQPCQRECNRESLGGVINVANLELACCTYRSTDEQKPVLIPKKNKTVAIIGAGVCGMTAAFDLSRKGYLVSLFDEQPAVGGRLWHISSDQLPKEVISRDALILDQMKVNILCGHKIDLERFNYSDYDAVLLATGSGEPQIPGFANETDGRIKVDPVTYQTNRENVFAGGEMLHSQSTIMSLSDGRRAAVSIDRFLQRVSLTASRKNEGASETLLFTNLEGIEPVTAIFPIDVQQGYTIDSAQREAQRCLLCECMECVKVCEYLESYGGYPRKYVRDIYNNLSIIMRQRRANKFINSCTLCGLCAEVCPTDLDMGEVIRETRRTMVTTSKMPISAHDFALRDMAFSNSQRFAYTFPTPGIGTCEYLFFPGCQLAASNPEYVSQIFDDLLSVVKEIGIMLRCCGAPADWSGEEDLFHENGGAMRLEWEQLGKPKLVLACSSCNNMVKRFLPEVETIPLWQIIAQSPRLIESSLVTSKKYMIHDPCTSRYELEWQNSARAIVDQLGVNFLELEMSRTLTECCGYGGVAWLANPELVHKMIQHRINEDESDYITYCVMCRDLFAAEGKPTLHLLDLIYGQDHEMLANRKPPDYSLRHENRIRVKQRMVKRLTGKEEGQLESYEKIKLQLSTDMRKVMEARLILVEDLQKVIDHATITGEFFVNKISGHSVASYKPNLITYWVEYKKNGDEFVVYDAYSHRMIVGGDTSV